MAEFKDRLKQLRKDNKMTQVMLGKRLNYGYTAIANYESGRNQPSIDVLVKLAEIFHTSIDFLVGFDNARSSNKQIINQDEVSDLHTIMLNLDDKKKEELLTFAKWLLFRAD